MSDSRTPQTSLQRTSSFIRNRSRSSSPFPGSLKSPSTDDSSPSRDTKGGGKGATKHFNSTNSSPTNTSIKSYAVYHDEIVTALIDEAMKKGESEASAAVVTGASGAQQVINTMRSSSPTKSKRSPVKQLGSPYKLRKLSRGGDSSGGGGGGETKHPTPSSSIGIISPASLFGLSKNPTDYFHKDCKLQKEVGRDAASQKLSTRSLSTSTKSSATGRAATLIKLQEKLSLLGDIESGKYGMAAEMLRSDAVAFGIQADSSSNSIDSSSTPPRKNNRVQKVETRSILTLRMGFVSICYGILLQWDCKSGLVELIVLRKMCHDDFLKRKGNDPSSSTTTAEESKSSQQLIPKSPPFLPPIPALIPIPLPTNSSTEVSLDSASTSIVARGSKSSRIALPHVTLPSYSLVGIPRFLSSTTMSADTRPQHYLSVSVLGVTKLVTECINCRPTNNDGETANSAIPSWNKFKLPMMTKKHHGPIRPYIRFSLGKHEHQTSVTRYYGKGSAKWSKRHDNTCLLPCPPEEMHWFAGREDLIVEVRNDWQQINTVFGMNFGERSHILASLKLPLSFINIENGDDITARGGTWNRRTNLYGTSSTKITIPLRMNCCSNAPIGSITLEITMNAPTSNSGSKGTAAAESSKHASSTLTTQLPNQVTNESIELGPLTRLIDGWSLGEWGGGDVEESNKKKSFRWSKRFDLQTRRWTKLISPKPTNPPPIERPWLVNLF